MLKQQITPREVVDFLNELLEIDRIGVSNLFNNRVPVNNDLAGHPTLQVRGNSDDPASMATLGLINGLFGVDKDGWGCIYRSLEGDSDIIIEFGLVTNNTKGK